MLEKGKNNRKKLSSTQSFRPRRSEHGEEMERLLVLAAPVLRPLAAAHRGEEDFSSATDLASANLKNITI